MSATPRNLGFLLHDVSRLMRKRFEQHARELGLTRAQWQVLVHLSQNEGIHQSGLAEIIEMEPITLVRILDRLETRGLVERRRHASDRRIWLLFLKEAAHPLLSVLRGFGDATRAEALEGLSDTDVGRLSDILTTMKTNLIKTCAQPSGDKEPSYG
jgi:MarR family transcriptional regulator for hemolysin